MSPPVIPKYVEGVIELTIDGRPIISTEMWDYVDELWCYISDMVPTFLATGKASTGFPDHPIDLTFRCVGDDDALVTLDIREDHRSVLVEKTELADALRRHGSEFLRIMSTLVPQHAEAYTAAIDALTALS